MKVASKKQVQGKLDVASPMRAGAEAERPAEPIHYPRNRLLSKMLQDRGILRIISAPRGYGKTSLAREYAERLFAGKLVTWVDAASPSFIAELDRGKLQGFDEFSAQQPELIVLDDVPWLHEERATALSRRIDTALYRGIEVIATTLPSCDCLSALQSERIFVSASDLEITEQECLDGHGDGKSSARVRAVRLWREARESFMGKVPAVAWGGGDEMRFRVLAWFFEERLSLDAFRVSCAVAILSSGTFLDLFGDELRLREGDIQLFARDYPFLCIDPVRRSFSAPELPLRMLKDALEESGLARMMREGSGALMARMLAALLRRGTLARAESVLEVFCTDEQCAHWLLECGWTLIDRGELRLVDSVLGRCPEALFDQSPILQTLRSWDSGLLGDERESVHYAQGVLRVRGAALPDEDEGRQGAEALAYLALVAFGGKGASIYAKDEFSPAFEPVTVEGFLARVVDLCTDGELERALRRGDAEALKRLDDERAPASESRAEGLSALFSQNDERLRDEPLYRLAFHVLCHVDSEILKPVVSGIGCEFMARLRRGGLSSYTGALLVRDLWRRGFFGSAGPSSDKRDAGVFESAGRILRAMEVSRDEEEADVPWEIGPHSFPAASLERKAGGRKREVELLSVRLFGSFEVILGDRYIKETEWRKKSRMLVILLVLNQGREISRDTLFAELWPGMSRVRALDNFYSVWSSACSLFDNGPYLERQESFCRINAQYVRSDVAEFEQLVRRLLTEHPDTNALLDTYARIEDLYRGGLVPSETDNQTINAQRARYEAMYVDAMIAATECSLGANDARLALWFARKAMETGQQREDLYQALARAQVAAGQRCSAIKTYFECRQYLRDNLGLDPSCDMQDLYNRLITVDPALLKLDPSSFKKR